MASISRYASNCFLLIIPALVINLVWAPQLPPLWRYDIFWKDIPSAIAITENVTRLIVSFLPLLMVLQVSTKRQKVGLSAYIVGMIAYLLAWLAMIYFPQSIWSTSLVGATATAWTTILWLAGIGLIGDTLFLRIPYRPWMYIGVSAIFAAVHTAHAVLVYLRIP